ncbi:hypothetical protein AAFF_G00428110 [Aldrovandia affinis]|uniref:Uncharacterized protein n=1 Tax=Aldrovandia affinis TaxID=143900 RepID=A0AAD7SBF3_9TELE|nr:hypothetical protein AAFF_G00428110 [Aldrovandia affinis]
MRRAADAHSCPGPHGLAIAAPSPSSSFRDGGDHITGAPCSPVSLSPAWILTGWNQCALTSQHAHLFSRAALSLTRAYVREGERDRSLTARRFGITAEPRGALWGRGARGSSAEPIRGESGDEARPAQPFQTSSAETDECLCAKRGFPVPARAGATEHRGEY